LTAWTTPSCVKNCVFRFFTSSSFAMKVCSFALENNDPRV
jgi:hypothetical protein